MSARRRLEEVGTIDPDRDPAPTLDFFLEPERNVVHGIANMSRVVFHRVVAALRATAGQTGNVDSIVWLSAWCELAITTERVPHGDLTETTGVAALLVHLKRTHPDITVTVHLGLEEAVEITEGGLDVLGSGDIEDFFAKRDRPPWADGPDRRRDPL